MYEWLFFIFLGLAVYCWTAQNIVWRGFSLIAGGKFIWWTEKFPGVLRVLLPFASIGLSVLAILHIFRWPFLLVVLGGALGWLQHTIKPLM